MKWLTTILSLYLMGLSLWPCSDERLPSIGQVASAVAASTATTLPGSAHAHHDQCTPFCTCTCCAATVTVAPSFRYTPTLLVRVLPLLSTSLGYVSLHWATPPAAIWQPPQLRV